MSVDSDSLREVVRELLAELLQAPEQAIRPRPGSPTRRDGTAEAESVIAVTVTSDADLQDLVLKVLEHGEDPIRRQAVRAGRIRFRLATTDDPADRLSGRDAQTLRIDRGALTERAVAAAAREGQSIVLGKRAVATPLALDKARTLGVRVRKEAT
jgi:hypothetical protein